MNDIHVRIRATANTAAARKEIHSLATQVRRINQDQRNALNIISGSGLQTQPLSRIRNELDSITESINKGKINMQQWGTVYRNQSRIIRRQSALSTSRLASMNDQIRGFKQGSLIFDNFNKAGVRLLDRFRLMSTATTALARNIVDIGKNVQWAGRQITVGFTVPFAIAAGLAARQFMKVEDQIVRFQKVFNENLGTPLTEATTRVKTLASTITDEMGRAQTDTLEVSATFAQMGKNIQEVETMTRETMRLSTLGEVDTTTSTDLIRGIQAVFRFTNEELTESINLLNAVENNTALTVDAMAQAMPQVLPIFQQFNLELGEGTAMLAGMNEILGNANEAATAFKAISQRMFDPTQEAVDKFAQYGIDLRQIVANNADDLSGFLVELGDILKDNNITAQQFAETFGNLMGVRQAGRGLSLMTSWSDAMNGLENDAARAYGVIETGAENAADAQVELDRQVNSLSGQFRRQIEQMKIDIADIGETVLEIALPIVKFIGNIINWIQGLDKGMRKFILIMAAALAAVGPLVMGFGIFINLAGTVAQFLARTLPGAQNLTTAAARASSLAIKEEEQSATRLLDRLFGLQTGLDGATAANHRFASSAQVAANAARGTSVGSGGPYRIPKGQVGAGQYTTKANWESKYSPEAKVANARSTPRSKTRIAGGFGTASSLLFVTSALASQSGAIESNFANAANNALMMASGLGMALPGITRLISRSQKLTGIFGTLGTKIATISGKFGGAGISATGAVALGATGILAAVGAIGIGIRRWAGHIDTAGNRLTNMNEQLDSIGQNLGLGERGSNLVTVTTEEGGVQDITKAVNESVATIMGARPEVALQRSYEIVLDLVTRGADIEAVQKIVTALERQGRFNIDIDLTNVDTAMRDLQRNMQDVFKKTFEDFASGKYNASGPMRVLQMRDRSIEGLEVGRGQGSAFADILMSGNKEFVREMVDYMKNEVVPIMSEIDENYFVDFVLEAMNMEELQDEIYNFDQLLHQVAGTLGEEVSAELSEFNTEMLAAQTALQESRNQFGQSMQMAGTRGMAEVVQAFMDLHAAGEITTAELASMQDAWDRLNNGMEPTETQMQLLDRVMGQLNDSAGLGIQGIEHFNTMMRMTGAIGEYVSLLFNAGEVRRLRREADAARMHALGEQNQAALADQLSELDFSGEAGTLEAVGEEAAEKAASDLSAKRSAIQSELNEYISEVLEGLKEQKDAIKDRYDEEIQAIKDTQDATEERLKAEREAEKELEEQRIANFEAEIRRQDRMSEELSENINLEAAIARGELDAAGQMRQDMMFGDIHDAFEEFKAVLDARSEERDKEVDKQIEASQESADAEVESLEDMRDAALEAHDERVEMIEDELELLKRTTPATVAEWNSRMGQISQVVTAHGGVIDAETQKFGVEGWSRALDNWQVELEEEARWEAMAESVRAGMETAVAPIPEVTKVAMDKMHKQIAEALWGEDYENLLQPWAPGLQPPIQNPGGPAPTGGSGNLSDFTDNIPLYHSGGGVKGLGEVPAILRAGEFVMNEDSVGKYGLDFMKSINAQRWHDGGPVGAGPVGPDTRATGGIFSGGIFGMFQSMIQQLLGSLSGTLGGLFGGLGGLLGNLFGMGGEELGGAEGRNPVPGGRVISVFGDPRGGGRRHMGIDIANNRGSPVVSAFGGQVIEAGVGSGGFGNRVWVHSPQKGLFHAYAHLDSIRARENTAVRPGSPIGTVGDTGNAKGTPPHLHWSANRNSPHSEAGSIDPQRLLQLNKGGGIRFNNTIANLHKGEHVLRAPTSKALEAGIKDLQTGDRGGNFTLKIDSFYGTEENIDKLAKKIEKIFDKKNDARGRRKVYG